MRVRKIKTRTIPVDLTMDEEALECASILGVSTSHRVYYRGSRPEGAEDASGWMNSAAGEGIEYVFTYMVFPESGPYEFLYQAARKPQDSYEFSSTSYFEAWRAASRHALKQASKELYAELTDTTPPKE